MAEELALTANASFVPTRLGLIITGNPTVNEWGEFGTKIRDVEGAIQWLIGDWLNYGELHYGEKYKEAIEKTGYEYSTLRDQKWLAGRFPVSRRHDNVSWSHHREVAGVRPDDKADELLDHAAENKWTQKELRKAVQDIDAPEIEEKPVVTGDCKQQKARAIEILRKYCAEGLKQHETFFDMIKEVVGVLEGTVN
jgi:hypothetical protein